MDKRRKFNSLEDIEKNLFQKKKEGASKKTLKTKRQTAMYVENPFVEFLRDYSRLLVIPAVVIILIAVIMIAEAVGAGGKGGSEGENGENAVSGTATMSSARISDDATSGEEVSESSSEAEDTGFKLNEDTRVERLINDYFYARLNADVDTLYTIFGRTTDTGRDELQKRLDAEKSWIQSYDGITTYVLPGLEDGEKLAVITYKINFRRTDTMAPGIMYCYISVRDDGSLYIEENLLKDKVDYINEQLALPEVEELIDSTDAELKAALDSDSDLALIYTSFNNGEIYKEQDLDVNREQEVDIMFTPEGSDLTGGLGDSIINLENPESSENVETSNSTESSEASAE